MPRNYGPTDRRSYAEAGLAFERAVIAGEREAHRWRLRREPRYIRQCSACRSHDNDAHRIGWDGLCPACRDGYGMPGDAYSECGQ